MRKSYEMVESWSLLALSDLGFVFTVFLSSLISKVIIMSHEHVSNIGRIWKVFGILSALQ
jgi:hypothetical protein